MNPQALELIKKGEAIIVHISDKLYSLNVPEDGTFDDSALENFSGSFLQQLLGDDDVNEQSKPYHNPLDID